MSLRLKLVLSFMAVSLTIVATFSLVTYTSARNYTRHLELNHIHEDNKLLISRLKPRPTLAEIQALLPLHDKNNSEFAIIDTQQHAIVSTQKLGFSEQLLAEISAQTGGDNQQHGSLTTGDTEYLWATDTVPGTPYIITSIYHRNANDIATFLKYIGTPLGVTILVGIWLALWVSTILANLINRVEDQKDLLSFQTNHDSLTQLPNRSAITDIIRASLDAAKISCNTPRNERRNFPCDERVVLCLLNLEALKDINDTLGYESGDILLRQATHRLQEMIRGSDKIGRFGGNKFAIIFTHASDTTVKALSEKLVNAFEPSFEINGQNLYVSASLGIAIYPDHADNAQSLIQKAETALHTANEMSVDFAVYDTRYNRSSTERLNLTHDLRNAIHNNELKLYYQPKLDVKSGTVKSVEALARWIHPQHGFVPPDTFIDIAERTGLIKPLTDWVLRTAVEQCKRWEETGNKIAISINLSARNLHDEALSDQISNLLAYWNVRPDQLCLEITETAMMADPEQAKSLLNRFDQLGVRISIDDFGTGYSSLGYLKQLPVAEIKIDKSFVLNMANDENDASIVRATIRLAHDLGLEVVAEGVEDQQAQELLQELGCEYIQGYHIGRPMPNEELLSTLSTINRHNEELPTYKSSATNRL
jgi:diguanylate cyclase (GGDEF)-like protein